jgi:hypothetical protein
VKKSPLSTKAMKALLAASIAFTPAIGLGFANGQPAEAAAYSGDYTTESELVSYLEKINATLTEDEKNDLRFVRAQLDNVSWNSYIDNLLADPETTSEDAKSVVNGLIELLMSTSTLSVSEDFAQFKAEYKDEVKRVFGDNITVEDLIGYIASTEGHFLDSVSKTSGDVSNINYFNMLIQSMESAKDDTSKNLEIHGKINGLLADQLTVAITFAAIIEENTALKSSLVKAKSVVINVVRNLPINPPAGGGGGVTPPPVDVEEGNVGEGALKDNPQAVADKIKEQEEFQNLIIEAAGASAEVSVPNVVLQAVAGKNPNAKIVVESELGSYELPVSEISFDRLAKELGVDASDIAIKINVKPAVDDKKAVVKAGLTSVSPVIEFSVVAVNPSGKEISIVKKKFSQYVDRVISGAASFDEKTSTGVRINDDGTLSPLPTYFDEANATIKSLTNSKYTVVQYEKTFNDVDNKKNWAEVHIEKLASKLVIKGKSKDIYSPAKNMTRGEFAALISRSLGLVASDNQAVSFSDVSPSQAVNQNGEIAAAVEAGIILGREDGKFYPGKEINRAEAAIMISRALDYAAVEVEMDTSKDVKDFKDAENIGVSAREHVEKVAEAGIMDGYTNGQFGPQDNTKRDQMAKILDNFLSKIKFIN